MNTNGCNGGQNSAGPPNGGNNGDAGHAPPPNAATASGSGGEEGSHSKRPAYAGQWRTPPLPVFPASDSGAEQQGQQPQPPPQQHKQQPDASSLSHQQPHHPPPHPPAGTHALPQVSELPDSTEDYAKALQEAYRRGAEAAAAMANQPPQPLPPPPHPHAHGHAAAYPQPPPPPAPHHHHHHHHHHPYGPPPPSSVSCPDFHATHPAKQGGSGDTAGATTTVLPEPIIPPPPPPPGAGMPIPNPMVPAPPPQSSASAAAAAAAAAASATMPPPPPQSRSGGGAAAVKSSSIPPQQQQQTANTKQPPRSMSLPDMTSYAAQQEEEKRQKRLARNRASARLRRLRKKNLVDAYETEVGILEKTLEKLKVHEWGEQDHPNALAEALSMDRGQQVLTAEQRKQAATDILQQQLQYLDMLEDVMQEQYVLYQLVKSSRDGDIEKRDELEDLRQALQLTSEQENQLLEAGAGWEDEWQALQLVKASLQAMKDNDWLWNEGCTKVADDFMSLLHKNQISKFLLWADHNVEAIDQLDLVNAPANVPEGPVFHFGVNSNPDGILEEERI